MHCPRCGQQQVSDHTKFCSRCGFLLTLVGRLLESNGVLPELEALNQQSSGWFTRKNGLIFTAVWLIFWMFMLPSFFGIADFGEGAAVSAVFGLFSSVILFIISLGFLKKGPSRKAIEQAEQYAHQPVAIAGSHHGAALPPRQTEAAQDYASPAGSWRTPDTGELATPSSVTENTTKLLKKEQQEDR